MTTATGARCQAVVIEAFGQVGAYFILNSFEIEEKLVQLRQIDWRRTARSWKGRCVKNNNKMTKSNQAIILTSNVIKKVLGIPLNDEEKKIEKLYELLENKDLDNETSVALKWAIFEIESIYKNKKGN